VYALTEPRWWRIELPSACFAIREDARGIVVECAPYARRQALGKRIEQVLGHYRRQGADVCALWYEDWHEGWNTQIS
jgi:hypothetical protein